jgi:plastocyanin
MRVPAAVVAAVLLIGLVSQAAVTRAQDSALRENAVEATASVEAVNRERREVMLRFDEGRIVTLTLGEGVRNFDQIEVGDTVRVVYVESVAAEMAAVDDTGATTTASGVARAPEGAKPGAAVGEEVSLVVTFESFDPATDTVTFTTEDGLRHSLVVHPDMRAFAMRREAGDRVRVRFTEGIAIVVEETEG